MLPAQSRAGIQGSSGSWVTRKRNGSVYLAPLYTHRRIEPPGYRNEKCREAVRNGRAPDTRYLQRKDGSRLFVEGTTIALKDSGAEAPRVLQGDTRS